MRTKLQQYVISKAYRRAKKQPWFSGGVCKDLLKDELCTDAQIRERGISNAVNDIYFDTVYWDATGFQGA